MPVPYLVLDQIFCEQMKFKLNELINPSIVTTVSAKNPKRVDSMEVRMHWYTNEFGEQVRYTFSNYMLYMILTN